MNDKLAKIMPAFPDPALGLHIRRDTSNGKEIEVCCTRTKTGWIPHLRYRKILNDSVPWTIPSVPFPKRGYPDIEEAYRIAFSLGYDLVFGIADSEHC